MATHVDAPRGSATVFCRRWTRSNATPEAERSRRAPRSIAPPPHDLTLSAMRLPMLLVTLLLGLAACQSSADPTTRDAAADSERASAVGAADSLHVTQLQRLSDYDWPEGGHYYLRVLAADDTSRGSEGTPPQVLLRELRAADADVTHAWHRAGTSSCSPPGSAMAMSVLVPEQLLVRTAAPWADAASHGFSAIDAPRIQCPYSVTLYVWQ